MHKNQINKGQNKYIAYKFDKNLVKNRKLIL